MRMHVSPFSFVPRVQAFAQVPVELKHRPSLMAVTGHASSLNMIAGGIVVAAPTEYANPLVPTS